MASPSPTPPFTAASATNDEWIAALEGPDRDAALAALREVLVRGLRAALAQRAPRHLNAYVEDFTQEALVKILDNLDTFRGESRFTTWAQKIAVRLALSELRRKRWRDVALDDLSPDDPGDYTPPALTDPELAPDARTNQQLLLDQVTHIIEHDLTDRQRTALTGAMNGMPLDALAEHMDTNRNALYKLLFDARKRLKQNLEQQGLSADQILAELG